MVRTIAVYESKYGNTELFAKSIAEGRREVSEIEAVPIEVKGWSWTR